MDTKVYIASIEQLPYKKLYNAASPKRKVKADAMLFAEDKHRCIAAEALLRHALKEQGIYDFQVLTDKNGKPYLQGLPVHFSLSHSGEFVLCAISEKAVGCDIQQSKQPDLKLAKRYFAAGEIRLLENAPALFYRLWVLKESFGKAQGSGLNERVLRQEFDLTGAKPVLKDNPELFFREFSLPGYQCAVCSQTANIFGLIEVVL
jgi:4'-phosphopantetheinyl transferase